MVEKKSVRTQSEALKALSDELLMTEALMCGTKAIRQECETFLPKWPKEKEDSYKLRVSVSTLHPVFKHTCEVMSSKPFSKAFTVEAPDAIQEYLNDIDRQGTTLQAYLMNVFLSCLSKGFDFVYVEYPKAAGNETKEQEKLLGLRPYICSYRAESFLGAKFDDEGLKQIRFLECIEEDEGEWDVKNTEQVRVFERGSWKTYRANEKGDWIEHSRGITKLKYIPIVCFYGEKIGRFIGRSPLLELAYQNVEHLQSSSDQQNILHVARVPILFMKMFGEGTLQVGASAAASSNNEKSDMKFVEHSGQAIESGRKSLLDLEDRMRATGAELISVKQASNITATQIGSEDEANKSTLQKIAIRFEESAKLLIEYMCDYIGIKGDVKVELFKDFNEISNQDVNYIKLAFDSKIISGETYFDELKRRDIISPQRTWTDELKKLISAKPIE